MKEEAVFEGGREESREKGSMKESMGGRREAEDVKDVGCRGSGGERQGEGGLDKRSMQSSGLEKQEMISSAKANSGLSLN